MIKQSRNKTSTVRTERKRRRSTMDLVLSFAFLSSFGIGLISCSNITIYIGGFIELNTTNGGWNSAGILPAVELAKTHINKESNVLKGIHLEVDMKDSKCSSAYTIKALVEHITSPNTKVAIVGPGCSISALPVADSAHFWNLLQVAYGAGTPRLSDNSKYPMFFRVNSPETVPNLAIVALLKYFNWRKVAIVKEDISVFNDVQENLDTLLRRNSISVISTNSFVNDPKNAVQGLIEKDARIIIALTYEKKCRMLMCAAYKQGLYGNHIQWLLRGWYNYRWWKFSDTECNVSDIRTVIGNYIGIEEKILSTVDKKTISGLTPSELQSLYVAKARNLSLPTNSYAPYGYDALWAIALALNQSISILAKNNKTLADFSYKDKYMASIFTGLVANTSFHGMSGLVEFQKNGDRINNLWIEQLQGDDEVKLGTFETKGSKPSVDHIKLNQSFVWPGGTIPKSEPEIVETMTTISHKLFITMSTMTFLGIFMACGFLCFNILYRKNSHIRMSSPHLNNLIIFGSLMVYICVFLLGSTGFLNESQLSVYRGMYVLRLWLMTCGFTLAFGTMFVKTWRVYKIFTNNNLNKELGCLHDRHLVILLVILLCVDIIILSSWQIFDPLQATIQRHITKSIDNRKVYYSKVFYCESTYQSAWTAALYSYKGLLLLFGLFLAWETRNVNFRALNDSRYIGMSVYNVVIWACISVPLKTWVTNSRIDADFGLLSAAINMCASSTLLLVFGPKVWAVKVAASTISPALDSKTASTEETKHSKRHAVCPGCKCE